MRSETRHLLAGIQVTPEKFDQISNTAAEFKNREFLELVRQEIQQVNDGDPGAISIFGEASSRTKLSFARAAMSIRLQLHTESNARISLSLAKNESIPDTARTLKALDYNLVIFRSDKEGEVAEFAEYSDAPVINAGDGPGEHPTQAILDADTILEAIGRLDNFTIVYAGDPGNSRTAHSLIDLLSHRSNVRQVFVSAPELAIDDELRLHLKERKVDFSEETSLDDVADSADVYMFLRFQEERQKQPEMKAEQLAAQREHLRREYMAALPIGQTLLKRIKDIDVRLAHPLPRGPELPEDLEGLPAGIWWNQIKKGLSDRKALEYLMITDKLKFPSLAAAQEESGEQPA